MDQQMDPQPGYGVAGASLMGEPSGDEALAGVDHRPWSTMLLAAHWLVVLLGLVGLVGGLVMVGADMADRTDSWDGFLAFVGMVLGGASAVAGIVAALLLTTTVRGRRRSDAGDHATLRSVATTSVVLGGLVVLVMLVVVGRWIAYAGGISMLVGLVTMVPALLMAAAGAGTLRSVRLPPGATAGPAQ